MHDNDIRAKTARKFRNTTDSNHPLPVADNLLDRQFDAQTPNERWVADITYIPTREGWLYLAAVEDLYSRMVVGWSMADTMDSRLVVDALEMAVQRRLPDEGLLAHSDRGSQYASEHYQRLLAKHGIDCSMSGVGQCWDNAPMESFFATLKKELVHHEDYQTRSRGADQHLRVHRDVLQPQAAALVAGLRLPRGVRTGRITRSLQSPIPGDCHPECSRGRTWKSSRASFLLPPHSFATHSLHQGLREWVAKECACLLVRPHQEAQQDRGPVAPESMRASDRNSPDNS